MQFTSTFYINRWETDTHSHPVLEVGATTDTWFRRTKQKFHNPTRSGTYDKTCQSYINEHQLGDVPLIAQCFIFPLTDDEYPLAFQLEQSVLQHLRYKQYEEVHKEWFRVPYDIVSWITLQKIARMEVKPTIESKSIKLSDISHKIDKGEIMSINRTTKTRPIKVLDWMLDKLLPAEDVVCLEYDHRNKNGTITPHWKFETNRGDYLYHCSTKKGYLHKKEVHDMLSQLVKDVS